MPKPTRNDFIVQAKRENWPWIDANLHDQDITHEDVLWALTEGMYDLNTEVRDLAATYLVVSSRPFTGTENNTARLWMMRDPSEIVQYRLAIALYKRGDRDPTVGALYKQALNGVDSEIRSVALKYQ